MYDIHDGDISFYPRYSSSCEWHKIEDKYKKYTKYLILSKFRFSGVIYRFLEKTFKKLGIKDRIVEVGLYRN